MLVPARQLWVIGRRAGTGQALGRPLGLEMVDVPGFAEHNCQLVCELWALGRLMRPEAHVLGEAARCSGQSISGLDVTGPPKVSAERLWGRSLPGCDWDVFVLLAQSTGGQAHPIAWLAFRRSHSALWPGAAISMHCADCCLPETRAGVWCV